MSFSCRDPKESKQAEWKAKAAALNKASENIPKFSLADSYSEDAQDMDAEISKKPSSVCDCCYCNFRIEECKAYQKLDANGYTGPYVFAYELDEHCDCI